MRPFLTRTRARLRQSLTPAVLAFLGAALLIALAPLPVLAAPVERTIRVAAGNYAFDPGVLRVNPGDRITIELISTDVVHSLSIDGYAVEVMAEPGQTARASFVAGRAGTYKIRCAMPCGNLHPFMTGKLQVGPNLLLLRAAGLSLLAFAFGAWKVLRG